MGGRQWIAIFSQTGGEIRNLSEALGRYPDVMLTNNMDYVRPTGIPDTTQIMLCTPERINEWLTTPGMVEEEALITAHGYLRIIPGRVIRFLEEHCKTHIFNGHPGLITRYPELRGKDPQARVYQGVHDGTYKLLGAVIHIIDRGIDTGPVVMSTQKAVERTDMTEQEVYDTLYTLSFRIWLALLRTELGR